MLGPNKTKNLGFNDGVRSSDHPVAFMINMVSQAFDLPR